MASQILREVKKEADGAADRIEIAIAKHVGDVQGLLAADFPHASPSAARALRPAAADAGPDPTQTNPEIERRLKLVQDQFELVRSMCSYNDTVALHIHTNTHMYIYICVCIHIYIYIYIV